MIFCLKNVTNNRLHEPMSHNTSGPYMQLIVNINNGMYSMYSILYAF